MIGFREFRKIEANIQESKRKLQQLIKESVENFRKGIITESIEDVQNLKELDLHQTEGVKRTLLSRFVDKFSQLSEEEQLNLVDELSRPYNEDYYIKNNNEIKLILIYKNNKNSLVGQEAYNKVVLNKKRMFETIALKKVKAGSIYPSQAADFVQQMFLTLCGGGEYNGMNDKRYSIDGYDPYSGVPFNGFIMSMTVPAAYNKFQARYDTSITNDYKRQREGTETVSADRDDIKKEVENILDQEEDQSSLMDKKLKNELIKAILNDELPEDLKLSETEKKFIKLHFIDGIAKKDVARKMGYRQKSAASIANRYLGSERNEDNDGIAIQHFKRALNYLLKHENEQKIQNQEDKKWRQKQEHLKDIKKWVTNLHKIDDKNSSNTNQEEDNSFIQYKKQLKDCTKEDEIRIVKLIDNAKLSFAAAGQKMNLSTAVARLLYDRAKTSNNKQINPDSEVINKEEIFKLIQDGKLSVYAAAKKLKLSQYETGKLYKKYKQEHQEINISKEKQSLTSDEQWVYNLVQKSSLPLSMAAKRLGLDVKQAYQLYQSAIEKMK